MAILLWDGEAAGKPCPGESALVVAFRIVLDDQEDGLASSAEFLPGNR